MRAILVCVDYADYLSITLPRNRHHFEQVMIVSTSDDHETAAVADACDTRLFQTNAFYDDGAKFNKWKALEQGLDALGREGWLCIMDADVLWPQVLPGQAFETGKLYTPFRRMMVDMSRPIPEEADWRQLQRHQQLREFAGYTQIFHADDPALGVAPWHQLDWRHAGGADSAFQARWEDRNKVRPAWECLHLGPAGQNWCGRASDYLDGRREPHADSRRGALQEFMRIRRERRSMDHERIRGESDRHG